MNVASSRQNAGTGSNKKKRKRRRHDHVFTLGIEEEFQIIDPETRELRSHIQQILADSKMVLQERVKPELHQSIAEVGTEICIDARDARQQVVSLRAELAKLAAQHGLKIASAGTHPFSHWMDQFITVTSATHRSSKTCSKLRAHASYLVCTYTSEFPIARRGSTS